MAHDCFNFQKQVTLFTLQIPPRSPVFHGVSGSFFLFLGCTSLETQRHQRQILLDFVLLLLNLQITEDERMKLGHVILIRQKDDRFTLVLGGKKGRWRTFFQSCAVGRLPKDILLPEKNTMGNSWETLQVAIVESTVAKYGGKSTGACSGQLLISIRILKHFYPKIAKALSENCDVFTGAFYQRHRERIDSGRTQCSKPRRYQETFGPQASRFRQMTLQQTKVECFV